MSDATSPRERPFKIIDGRKWVLADGESLPAEELEHAEDPEIMARIGPPPREVPFMLGVDLRLRSGSASLLGWFFMAFALIFLIIAAYTGFDDTIPRRWKPAFVSSLDY